MKNCKTCKHWNPLNEYIAQYYSEGYGFCDVSNLDDSNRLMESTCLSEGIMGELITKENFGCILHENNSANQPRE